MMRKHLWFLTILLAIAQQAWAWEGSGTSADPYLIKTSADWKQLANDVGGGNSYSGKFFEMTADIDAQGISVGASDKPFSGTFSGGMHTLTYNRGTKDDANGVQPVDDYCAPFVRLEGATIRHLRVKGEVYSSHMHAAGIASLIDGAQATTISNCHVSSVLFAAKNLTEDASFGGLVGEVLSTCKASPVITGSSFTGKLDGWCTSSGGLVAFTSSKGITFEHCVFDPQNIAYIQGTPATFVRMAPGVKSTFKECYYTQVFGTQQGEAVFSGVDVAEDCTYEMLTEPTIDFDGHKYYQNGAQIRLTAPADKAFAHWATNSSCFISDPWQKDGIQVISDVKMKPYLRYYDKKVEAKDGLTIDGTRYRYLSRDDYYYYLSDETCAKKGYYLDGDWLVKMVDGTKVYVMAVTGFDASSLPSDGVQIHNDLVAVPLQRPHTLTAIIAPHAFEGCPMQSVYFKDTDANLNNAATEFDFIIGPMAFANCPNLTEVKMMQYTTRGTNHWEALKPSQVSSIASNVFSGSPQAYFSTDASEYQNYLASATWKDYQNRVIVYNHTNTDMNVNGAQYSYMRNTAGNPLKNSSEDHTTLMQSLRLWNADYQDFTASSLLSTSDENIWYTQVVGVDKGSLDKGTMRIYNDPGSYYNYKTIAVQSLGESKDVTAIEFWQTNGRSENSLTDLKMVIRNGALKGCTNLKEIRLFYYVQDGDNHWETLGPQDVIPGDNIFGLPDETSLAGLKGEERNAAIDACMPKDLKILVSPDRYQEFLDDPNWLPYTSYLSPVDFNPNSGNMSDFELGGLTYGYMTSPGGIMQTSQTVSQDVSWWTAPRIALEAMLWYMQIKQIVASFKPATLLAESQELEKFAVPKTGEQLAKTQTVPLLQELSKSNVANKYLLQMVNVAERDLVKPIRQLANMGYLTINVAEDGAKTFTWANNFAEVLANFWGADGLENGADLAVNFAVQDLRLYIAELGKKALTSALPSVLKRSAAYAGAIAKAGLVSSAGLISSECWGGSGSYEGDALRKGMRTNILSNIHQVSLVGGGYVITTPTKNLVYHTYIKNVPDQEEVTIYAGTGKKQGMNNNARTMTWTKDAFRNKTKLKTIKFFENTVESDEAIPMLLTIPDSAFVGCTNLTTIDLRVQTKSNGTQALGPESFIMGGDHVFAGVDSTKIRIIIDPSRKQDFLDNESWAPMQKCFVYEPAVPKTQYQEYGGNYAYAYENGTTQKVHKVSGHKIEHTEVTGADDEFLTGHQGALKLCNDIGVWNNFQLDAVTTKAFMGNQNLRVVNFTDLKGTGAYGDSYTGLQVALMDSCFTNCKNLNNIDMLYLVTDGDNKIDPISPEQVTIGKGVFDGTQAKIKMLPQQVAWFEADTAWAKYKDRFLPCIIKPGDEGIKKALKPMAYYDMANTGYDPATWDDYIDLSRIAGAGFSWLDGKFSEQGDDIYSFADFKHFECVGLDYVGKDWFRNCHNMSNIVLPKTIKRIEDNAFASCYKLEEIELPANVGKIGSEAFTGTPLHTVVVRSTTPCSLGSGVFPKNAGLKIYVPAASVDAYKTAWAEYKDYIVSDGTYKINKVVTVPQAGTLADQLGLFVEWTTTAEGGDEPHYIHRNYSKYDSLTVSGPLNDVDLWVIRYLAGNNGYYRGGEPTDGGLRYLNLYNASIVKDNNKAHYLNKSWGIDFAMQSIGANDELPNYLFYNCTALETIILPKTITSLTHATFNGCTALKRLAVTGKLQQYDGWQYSTHLLDNPLPELVFITDQHATTTAKDPWGAPIQQVYTLQSQLGDYMNDVSLYTQTQNIMAPFADDAVMETLAQKGQFFPSEYLEKESIGKLFEEGNKITRFEDFKLFARVKELEPGAFYGCTNMKSIALPDSLERIARTAFGNCQSLDTIYISADSVPELAEHAFADLPADFRILVPKSLCKLYRTKWAEYADHINVDEGYYQSTPVRTVTVTAPNTLAKALGLEPEISRTWDIWSKYLHGLKGDYSRITRLKVVGPISATDFDVLRYLAGYCPWKQERNYMGPLEYIDLYDAQIVEDGGYSLIGKGTVAGGPMSIGVDADVLPSCAFQNAYNLKTLILPKTCKKVNTRAMIGCEGLETLVIGDDMEEFNWDALDDDAMLTRMYILAKKKPEISAEWAVWRKLCNNYNPTFDAFYVRPSLYDEYLSDTNYTGSSWQRTNNISKGAFDDDDSFCAFASHAAATQDDLAGITDVKGWFDSHPGVKDLTPLKFTAVDSLDKATIAPLAQLEQIGMPALLGAFEEGLFEKNKRLRYVDLLMSHDKELMRRLKDGTHRLLGTNEKNTLVYMPAEYGDVGGTNVIVDTKGKLTASEYYLNDTLDYMVPYAFDALSIVNSRKLPASDVPYTVCLPYSMTLPRGAAATYKLSQRDGNKLVFEEVTDDEDVQAMHPYLIMVYGDEDLQGNSFSLDSKSGAAQTIPASTGIRMEQDDAPGYSVRGTLKTVSNSEAADMGAYILQSDGDWYPVRTSNTKAEILPYRCYLLPSARNAGARIRMSLAGNGNTTGIDTIETVDRDGTHTYYDLQGRRIDPGNAKGVVIKDGKKIVVK